MEKFISIAIFVGGILLFIYGIVASDSFGSNISLISSVTSTYKAFFLLTSGSIITYIGLIELRQNKRNQ